MSQAGIIPATLTKGTAYQSGQYAWLDGQTPPQKTDLTGKTITAQLRGQGVTVPVSVAIAPDNTFNFSLTQAQVDSLTTGQYLFTSNIDGLTTGPFEQFSDRWVVVDAGGIPLPATDNSTHTFTTSSPHGFQLLNVVSKVAGTWVLADKDGPLDIFVIVRISGPNEFTVGLDGYFEISHSFGNEPADLFLGDNGQLTLTPPPVVPLNSSEPRKQIAIASVLNSNRIWINPERRAW